MGVFKNFENVWKKYIVASILTFGSLGLFFQISNTYLLIQTKSKDSSFLNIHNLYSAIKKGGLLIIFDIFLLILIITNLQFVYSLNYPKIITLFILIINYIFLFEIVIINIFYSMFIIDNRFIESLKKSLIIGNLNIGLTILIILFSTIILSCIALSPLTGLILFPILMKALQVVYFKLEEKYLNLTLNTI